MSSFNLGLNQKRFGSTPVGANTINIGSTRGIGSSNRLLNHCKQNSQNSEDSTSCMDKFIKLLNGKPKRRRKLPRHKPPIKPPIEHPTWPFLRFIMGWGPGIGIINTNFGWDINGVWFSGNARSNYPSYPIFTNFTIPANKKVEVSVDFDYFARESDFGICFYLDNTVPKWNWSYDNTRIACQYDDVWPFIHGLNDSNSTYNDVLSIPNTYTCNVIYDPNNEPNVTFHTLLNGVIVDSCTLNGQTLGVDYRIGFCADNDDIASKSYMRNVTININNGEKIYSNNLNNISIPEISIPDL